MRRLVLAALSLLLVSTAAAAEWKYEGGSVPIAWFDTDAAQFQFACRGGQLAMGFWVRKPDPTVAGASAMSLAITPDPAAGGSTVYAQDMPLVHLDGTSVIVRGPVARQWARIAQAARTDMRVSYVRQTAAGLEALDPSVFGAKGSSAAIAQVLAKCG